MPAMDLSKHREVIFTADGSPTIFIPSMHVTYHSKHGAVQESMHIFIKAGLMHAAHNTKSIRIFELGFGTGLNALLSLQFAIKHNLEIYYFTTELFPLYEEEYIQLNYSRHINDTSLHHYFLQMHACAPEQDIEICPQFTLHKTKQAVAAISQRKHFNLIYFDAFDPAAQPELWAKEIFDAMYSIMNNDAVLVTYCSKGDVRRAMLAAGFTVEKLKGPPGKREILRAWKKADMYV